MTRAYLKFSKQTFTFEEDGTEIGYREFCYAAYVTIAKTLMLVGVQDRAFLVAYDPHSDMIMVRAKREHMNPVRSYSGKVDLEASACHDLFTRVKATFMMEEQTCQETSEQS